MTVQPIQPQDRMKSTKKVTGGSKKRKQESMDAEAFGMRVDGVEYVLNLNDITGRLDFEVRRECQMGVIEILQAAAQTNGLDYIGMFMWACKRAQGETVELMDILDSVNANSDAEEMTSAEILAVQGASPKASASAS